jgi:hypothetical protein
MAARVKLASLSEDEKKEILKSVQIKSVDKYVPSGVGKGKKLATPTIINCFELEEENNEKYISLPYNYMCNYRNKLYNLNKSFSLFKDNKNILKEEKDNKDILKEEEKDKNKDILKEKKDNKDILKEEKDNKDSSSLIKEDNIFIGEPRENQVSVLEEALIELNKKHTVSLELPTSYGKTFMGIYLAVKLGYRVCILNYRETIEKSWINEIIKRVDKNHLRLYVVGKGKDKKMYKNKDPNIILSLVGSVHTLPKEWIDQTGTLIIDESHSFNTEKRIKAILTFKPKFIIGLSATQYLENGLHKAMELIVGEKKITRKQDKPYDAFIINTNITYHSDDYVEYISEQAECEKRRKLIEKIIFDNPEHKIIVLASRTDMCDKIGETLEGKESYAKLYKLIKSYKNSRVLLGTFSKMGTGFDESNFCEDFDYPSNLGIVTYTNKTFAPFTQAKGRVMRNDNPILVYFRDNHHYSKYHLKTMIEWIKESNGTIYEFDYREEENNRINLNEIKKIKDCLNELL